MQIQGRILVMKTSVTAVGLSLVLASGGAMAQGFQQQNLYAGGGVTLNSLSGYDDATGFQIFAGYNLGQHFNTGPFSIAAEVGYLSTGDFDNHSNRPDTEHEGVWLTGVLGYALTERFQFIGRAGMDFGDDDGPMFGLGAGYALSNNLELRGEYVARDNINSTQANLAYHF